MIELTSNIGLYFFITAVVGLGMGIAQEHTPPKEGESKLSVAVRMTLSFAFLVCMGWFLTPLMIGIIIIDYFNNIKIKL